MDPSYHIRGRENSINVEKYLVESSQVYKLLLCVILCKLSNLKFKLGSLLDNTTDIYVAKFLTSILNNLDGGLI